MKEVNFDPINHSAAKALGVDCLVIIKRLTRHKTERKKKLQVLQSEQGTPSWTQVIN